MRPGTVATIIIESSVTQRPLLEIEAIAAKAVALLACKPDAISATIFRKPKGNSYWITLAAHGPLIRALYELKPQAPVVDFKVIYRAVSDIVATADTADTEEAKG